MSGDAAGTIDPELANLAPEVVEGYRNAPETMVVEIIDGELSVMPRPRLEEVLSPSTERVDRGRKLAIYHREGVGHVWLVSPTLRSVEVYRRADIGWLLLATFEGDAVVHAEPFDAVPLELAGLWAL